MKKLILVSLVLITAACSKDPVVPPGPGPKVTTFTAGNSNIQIQGEILPGAKSSVEEAKAAVNLAVDMLEKP